MRWTNGDFVKQLQDLKSQEGTRLQVVQTFDQGLELQFWSSEQGKRQWYFDLNLKSPGFYLIPENKKLPFKRHKKPLELFLSSHLKSKILQSILWKKKYGRVFQLLFTDGKYIEFRLFPHGVNVCVQANDKSIYWRKPSELKKLEEYVEQEATFTKGKTAEQIWDLRFGLVKQKKSATKSEDKLNKLLKVKQKLEKSLGPEEVKKWNEKALALQGGEDADLPKPEKDLQWNVEYCFKKSKQEKENLKGRKIRIEELDKEIKKLQGPQKSKAAKPNVDLFQKSQGKGQSAHLSSGHKIYFGKTAADNLRLLRSSAAWHQWFHVKDIPGSHGILVKNKKEVLSANTLSEAALELLKFSYRSKPEKAKGQKFDVITTEIRYVRPIKGDKLGRVNYSSESILRVSFD